MNRCEALRPKVLLLMALHANASKSIYAQTSKLVAHNCFRYARIFMYLENCIQRNIDDKIKKYLIKTSEVMLTNIN